jgi:O-antigen/teichoic acid export membrane protein
VGLTWRGRVAAEIVAWLSFAIVAVFLMTRWKWLSGGFDASYARNIAAFGIPLIPHTLGSALMVQTDRLLLTNLVGVDQTGLYVVAFQLATVVELAALSFNNAYAPWLFERLAKIDDETRHQLVRYTYLQFGLMAALAAVVAFVMPRIAAVLLGPRFEASGQFVGWLALGFLFSGMYYMVTNYIFFAQRTTWLAAVTISVAVINIPLTYALISINGAIGAAQATAISFGLSFVGTWIVSQHVYPMPWFSFLRRWSGAGRP